MGFRGLAVLWCRDWQVKMGKFFTTTEAHPLHLSKNTRDYSSSSFAQVVYPSHRLDMRDISTVYIYITATSNLDIPSVISLHTSIPALCDSPTMAVEGIRSHLGALPLAAVLA